MIVDETFLKLSRDVNREFVTESPEGAETSSTA
jgi:hypothetical protein